MPCRKLYERLPALMRRDDGHHHRMVFQLHVTNATGMNKRSVIADTNYDWGRGEIALGFNLSLSFNLKKNKKIVFN